MNFVAMMELTLNVLLFGCILVFPVKVMGTKYPDFIPACTKEQTGDNII